MALFQLHSTRFCDLVSNYRSPSTWQSLLCVWVPCHSHSPWPLTLSSATLIPYIVNVKEKKKRKNFLVSSFGIIAFFWQEITRKLNKQK